MSERSDTIHGPMRFWLIVVKDGRPERAVEVTGSRFVIGRGESCDLVLPDPKVSTEHAVIVPGVGAQRLLHDLDSTNGTLVNGRPITRPFGFTAGSDKVAELWGEERLQFGDTMLVAATQDPQAFLAGQSSGDDHSAGSVSGDPGASGSDVPSQHRDRSPDRADP